MTDIKGTKIEPKEGAAAIPTIPDLRVGYTVSVYQKIKEGDKTRTQMYEGLIIAMGGQTKKTRTITVRKISSGIGVERIFPLASPLIEKIVVRRIAKVRRSKLGYVRKSKKQLKETILKDEK